MQGLTIFIGLAAENRLRSYSPKTHSKLSSLEDKIIKFFRLNSDHFKAKIVSPV